MRTAATRFRLKGRVGDMVRSFALPTGEVAVGSASGNRIVLGVAGVSRHHAVLRVADDVVEVRDQQSKNGVQVNGTRVTEASLSADDEVKFGPVALRLELVDADDVDVALDLGGESGQEGPSDEPRITATWSSGPSPDDWLILVEHLIPLFRSGPAALGDALAELVSEAGLQGCCVVELQEEEMVLLGASGIVGVLDDAALIVAVRATSGAGSLGSLTRPGSPHVTGAFAPTTPPRGILAWHLSESRSLERALRIVVQLMPWAASLPQAAKPGALETRPLTFPRRHVRGTSRAMVELYRRMEPIADTDLPVLIVGETGVGKEDLARGLHLSSRRAQGPFVAVNCAAIPSELLEAELFGVGKGAATGVQPRQGRFQLAHRGTLFLDEVGEMGAPLQAKLLRALETGEVEPLAASPVRVDLRFLSATNADLATRIEGGQFRADLYYRLSGLLLRVPPLRERREDIPTLVDGILRPLAAHSAKPIRGVSAKALRALVDYHWPGNVRELEHELQRLLYDCAPGEVIDYGMLGEEIRAPRRPVGAQEDDSLELQRHVDALEERLIKEALLRTGGNRTEAARMLGVSRNGLALKMTRLGLDA